MKIKLLSPILCLLCLMNWSECFCQRNEGDDILMKQMLSRILHIQKNPGARDFPRGMIPSYRVSVRRQDVLKNDDNIFFTGLVVFTLRYLYNDLPKSSQEICDSIFAVAEPLYKRHQNKNGRATYNYWQTGKPEIFPNGGLLNLFNKSQALPDDMDVTSIILLAEDAPVSRVSEVHQLMQGYTNGKFKKIKNTLPEYKDLPAYSTWFGNKMPIDFDFCVLANVLYMVNKYQLPYTEADSASLHLLTMVIENRHHINKAAAMSPSYNRSAVLIYHLARLMAQQKNPSLEQYKQQLIKDAEALYKRADNFFDKIILSSSLMRWGVKPADDYLSIHTSIESFTEDNDFVFFIANIASMLPRKWSEALSKTGLGKFFYYSPGYNYALMIENMVLRSKLKY